MYIISSNEHGNALLVLVFSWDLFDNNTNTGLTLCCFFAYKEFFFV